MGRSFKNYLFILIAIMSIYGKCNKIDVNQCAGSCYNITGVVKDSLTGTPIANAEVEIATLNRANFLSGTYGKGQTNSDGIYNLFYPSKGLDFRTFYLNVSITAPSDYITDDSRLTNIVSEKIYDSPSVNVPVVINATFFKKALLNVRIIKGSNNNILNSFNNRFGRSGYNYIATFPSTSNTDTTYRFETAGGIKNYLNWEIKNGSTINKFIDSVVIAPGQTKDFVIRL